MGEVVSVRCSVSIEHGPHFYVSAIASGTPGLLPQMTCACPGAGDLSDAGGRVEP